MHELVGLRVIDVDVIETDRGGDEPLPIRAETDLIRVARGDPLLFDAGGAVDQHQFVAARHRDDQRAGVGGRDQVMRAAPDMDARCFAIVAAVDDADRIVIGIEHDRGCRTNWQPANEGPRGPLANSAA